MMVWFGFFILWNINLRGLFNAEAILVVEKKWYYLTHNLWVYTILNGNSLNVNVIAHLAFELTY